MPAETPNELAGAILTRVFTDQGEVWKVSVWVSSRAVTPLKAVTALKSGVLQAQVKVLAGEMPARGNGPVEQLNLTVRPIGYDHERG